MESTVFKKAWAWAVAAAVVAAGCLSAAQAWAEEGPSLGAAGIAAQSAGDELYLEGDEYDLANQFFYKVTPGYRVDLKDAQAAVHDTMTTIKGETEYDDNIDVYFIAPKAYTGSQLRPAVEVVIPEEDIGWDEIILLRPGVDYTLSYGPNVSGTGTVTATGINYFTGSVTQTFEITGSPASGAAAKASLADATVAPITAKAYTGKAVEPKPAVTLAGKALVAGRDYTLSYKSNKSAGKASVTVTGKGSYTGTKTAEFTISKAKMSKAKVSSISNKKRTGKAVKPKPTVKFGGKKLKLNKDYTLSYKNNVKAGKATVTIKGKGNFTGTKKVGFKIVA